MNPEFRVYLLPECLINPDPKVKDPQALGVPLHQRETLRMGASAGQLMLGEVQAYSPRSRPSQRLRPLSRPATKFENVTGFDITQHTKLGFRDAPHTPGHGTPAERWSMLSLVRAAYGVPERAVLRG